MDFSMDLSPRKLPGLNMEGMPPPPPPVFPLNLQESLIAPKKLRNPCLESSQHQNLRRELLFNHKIGKSVLNQKTELQRAMEKREQARIMREEQQKLREQKTAFERIIEERAKKIESMEKCEMDGEKLPEFLRVRAKLQAKMQSSNSCCS